MRVTFTYNGVRYVDYELLTPNLDCINYFGPSYYALGKNEKLMLCNGDAMRSIIPVVKPADGSSLYISQPCPLCNADIRKNYTIKRSPDAAEYAVMSPLDGNDRSIFSYATAIIPQLKQVICFLSRTWATTHSISAHVMDCVQRADITGSAIYPPEIIRFHVKELTDFQIAFLNGTLKTPVVYYKDLNMETGNMLNTDLLYLVYKTGTASRSKEDCEKLILQMQSLNQTNWREYPGTIYMLFANLIGNGGSTYLECAWTPSKLPKAVKQFARRELEYISPASMSPKDFDMTKSFLMMLLGIEGTKYVTINSIESKMSEFGINAEILSDFFDVTVRIAPKTINT